MPLKLKKKTRRPMTLGQLKQHCSEMLRKRWSMDADEAVLSAEALTVVRGQVYEAPVQKLRSRENIPTNNSVNNAAELMKVYYSSEVGLAALLASLADDIPLVELKQESRTMDFKSVGVGYMTSIQELRAASFAGYPIEAKKGVAAKNAINLKLDQIARVGDSASGLLGFFNNPYTTLYTIPVGDGGHQSWLLDKTPDEILEDLYRMSEAGYRATLETEEADTMLMDLDLYRKISTTRMPDSSDSIKKTFLESQDRITRIGAWDALKTAGASGTSRIITYRNSPDCLEQIIPQEFEQFPPQPKNLALRTPCHARTGGVAIYFPLGVVYADMNKAA